MGVDSWDFTLFYFIFCRNSRKFLLFNRAISDSSHHFKRRDKPELGKSEDDKRIGIQLMGLR